MHETNIKCFPYQYFHASKGSGRNSLVVAVRGGSKSYVSDLENRAREGRATDISDEK